MFRKVFIAYVGLFLLYAEIHAQLSLEPFVTGLIQPVDIENAGDGTNRIFIVEKPGIIRIADHRGNLSSQPFLNITSKVDNSDTEEGLLGLVFHPQYPVNGYFFVYYINTRNGQRRSIVERYTVSNDPDIADPGSAVEVMAFDQPQSNHNGGDMSFGPQGNLYIGVGDGGSGNDPGERSQNLTLPLGKMLRINVDQLPYSIPADNPFANATGDTVKAIWAWGLRNPWRFSFDENYDLWIGDVGQSAREEINFIPAADNVAGLNYGWDCREGNIACPGCGNNNCDDLEFTEPLYWYGPGPGLSVTGGYVMRGDYYDAYEGRYIFADFVQDEIRILEVTPSQSVSISHAIPANKISTFGKDEQGRIYAADFSGTIYQIVESGIFPIELITVHIQKHEKTILLDWETGFDLEALHFQIERNFNKGGFQQIGIVPARDNSEGQMAYQYLDELVHPGQYSYRLKTIAQDGSFTYSMTLDTEINELENLLVVPNPAIDRISVQVPGTNEGGTLQLISLDGKILLTQPIAANNSDPVDLSLKDYHRGLILVQFVGIRGTTHTRKLMLY